MARIAVIGEPTRVGGFALAGAVVCPAETAEQSQQAWQALPVDVAVVVMTASAADAIGADRHRPGAPLTVVAPP